MFDFFTVFMWTIFALGLLAIVGFSLSVLQTQRSERRGAARSSAARPGPKQASGARRGPRSSSARGAAPARQSSQKARRSPGRKKR